MNDNANTDWSNYYNVAVGTHVAIEAEVVEVLKGSYRVKVGDSVATVDIGDIQKVQDGDRGQWVVYVP